ncbi:MAG TPA: hypothetical protein PL009_10420 [Flavipsychrobacter sp.]|mgnify:CR=1 FL=1|nr:hypothetical protein [Flavipsychrobacter sp.]
MREISIRIGYKFLLTNPQFAWYVHNDKLDSKQVMEYLLQSVGEKIFSGVREGDSFTMHLIGDNKSRSFVLKRLPDGNVTRSEEGIFGKTFTEVYSVNLEIVSTGQVFSINHYYAGGGSKSNATTKLTGVFSAFTGYVSGIVSDTQNGFNKVKEQFDIDKSLNNYN